MIPIKISKKKKSARGTITEDVIEKINKIKCEIFRNVGLNIIRKVERGIFIGRRRFQYSKQIINVLECKRYLKFSTLI